MTLTRLVGTVFVEEVTQVTGETETEYNRGPETLGVAKQFVFDEENLGKLGFCCGSCCYHRDINPPKVSFFMIKLITSKLSKLHKYSQYT